jgi:hypothetical protein
MNNASNKLSLLQNTNIKTIFLSKNNLQNRHKYIYPGNNIFFTASDNQDNPLKLEIVMQTIDNEGFEKFKLNEDEILISKNASQKLNLAIGDYITGNLSYMKTGKKYRVAGITGYFCGTLYNPLSNWPLVILGYDPDYEANINTKYIILSDIEINDFDLFELNSLDNNKSIIITKAFKITLFLLSVFYYALFCILTVVIFILIKKMFGDFWPDYLAYLFKLGYSAAGITLSFSLLSALVVSLPLAASYLLILIINGNIPVNLNVNIIVLLLCILLTALWIVIGLNKCHKQARFKSGK